MARQLLQADRIERVTEKDLELSITPDPEAVYFLRSLGKDKVREIIASHKRKVPNKFTHQMVTETDEEAASDDLLDYAIERWEGVTENGEPSPCDREHKLRLPAEVQACIVQRAQIGQVTAAQQAASFRKPRRVG